MKDGVECPPLVVFRNWKSEGWSLLDGADRTNALVALGIQTAQAYVLDGLSLDGGCSEACCRSGVVGDIRRLTSPTSLPRGSRA